MAHNPHSKTTTKYNEYMPNTQEAYEIVAQKMENLKKRIKAAKDKRAAFSNQLQVVQNGIYNVDKELKELNGLYESHKVMMGLVAGSWALVY